MKRRIVLALASAIVAAPLLAACSGASGEIEHPLQIAVGDGSLRTVGDDCAGTAPYRHVHAGAELVLTDDGGNEVLRRSLSAGVAEPASDIDFENTPRIPTICLFTVDAGDLPADGTFEVTIADKPHGAFTYSPEAEGIPTILVPAATAKGTP